MSKEGSMNQFRERERKELSQGLHLRRENELQELVNETEKEQSRVRNRPRSVDTHLAQTHPYSLSTLTRTSFQKNKLPFKYDITFKGSSVMGHRSLLSVEFLRHRYFSKSSQIRKSRGFLYSFFGCSLFPVLRQYFHSYLNFCI